MNPLKRKRGWAILPIAICLMPASHFGQGLQRLPDSNLFPPGSSSNPIYVKPVPSPVPIYPPTFPTPIVPNINPPREREGPRKLAPRDEFESTRFISVEPYAYTISKGDRCFPSTAKAPRLPSGKRRVVIGKAKQLNTGDARDQKDNVNEVRAIVDKYHCDEIIVRPGRVWDDGAEMLIKFVVWK